MTAGAGDCTLAAAVGESNALEGVDSIALPAGTVAAGPLLFIRDSVVVSGAGPARTTILGSGTDTALHFDSLDVTLVGVTVAGGAGVNVGGGITNYSGHLTIIDCVIRDNAAGNVGGGIYNQGGRLTVIGSTIANNYAHNVGGGLHNDGVAELINTTITGNRVLNTGGGIHNEGTLTLSNCTITNNGCVNTGAGIDNRSGGTVVMRNTIASGNFVYSFPIPGMTPPEGPLGYVDCIGPIESEGHNLIRDPFPGLCLLGPASDEGDLLGVDPLLGPLQENGGPTPTQALQEGSPAIDAGDPAAPGSGGSACAATDQRGIARPGGSRCDIGAYEQTTCGNGTLDPDEECDDGGNADGDGCDSSCTVTRCGNGVTTAGEECDDGNALDGDCCSAACAIVSGEAVEPTTSGATIDLRAGRAGRFKFEWASGTAAAAPGSFGHPKSTTALSFCLIDTSGAAARLLASLSVPAGAGWSGSGDSFRYRAASKTPGTLTKVRLKRGKIVMGGMTPELGPGELPMVTPVRVQVVPSDGGPSWAAVFEGAIINRIATFRARSR